MTVGRRVGLLSALEHPLLPHFLDLLEPTDVEPVLILDAKRFMAKDRAIFEERTQGRLSRRELDPFLERYRWTVVPDHNGVECLTFVEEEKIALLVNAGTPRIIRAPLLGATPHGIVNVHPGILPKYRGASCCEWAIYHDEPIGVTVHFMDAGLDSGPILFTRELAVEPGQTYSDVRVALYRLEHETRVAAIRHVLDTGLTPEILPRQPDFPVFKPMPNELLAMIKTKLVAGQYRPSRSG